MAQRDWFAQNAPTAKPAQLNPDGSETPATLEIQNQSDWFSANAPQVSRPSEPGLLSSAASTAAGLVRGIGSGVMSTSLGVSKLLGAVPKSTTLEDIGMQPRNTAEELGMGIEQVGEFFLPGGAAKGAGLLRRAAIEAGQAAGITAAQTGGNVPAMRTAATIAGAVPLVGKAVQPIAAATKSLLSQRIAPRIVNSIIKPSKTEFRFGRDPGAEVAVQGLKARTMEGLEKEIVQRSSSVGRQIDRTLSLPSNAAKRIDVVPLVTQPIDDAIKAARVDGNQSLVSRLESFKKGQLMERFNLTQQPKALRLNPLDSRKLKTDIGKATRWTQDPIEGSLNQVRQDIYRNLNDAIDQAVPGVKDMNRSYGNLLSAEKAVQSRNEILKKANFIGLSDLGTGIATGFVTAALSGELSTDAAISAIVGGTVSKSLKSPGMTFLAARLAKLSPTERTIIAERVVPILRNLSLASNATAGRVSE